MNVVVYVIVLVYVIVNVLVYVNVPVYVIVIVHVPVYVIVIVDVIVYVDVLVHDHVLVYVHVPVSKNSPSMTTPTTSWEEYPATYREREVQTLLSAVRAGESASLVGLSGAGKSNVMGFLAHRVSLPDHRFALVDCNRLTERR